MRISSSSKIRHESPKPTLRLSDSMKVNTTPTPAGLKTQHSSIKANFLFILLLLFPKPLHVSQVSQNKARIRIWAQPKAWSTHCGVLCKVKSVQCHYYCTPSIPSKSFSDSYYSNMCDRKQPLPPPAPLLFLCWEGDRRHLVTHLFTLQTRPKLVAFPAVFQKQVIK